MSRIQGSLFVLAASVLVGALGVQPASASSPGARASGDRDCSDFSNQRDAQEYFRSRGGPDSDPDRLDADGDGRACDSLPCPCGSGGGGPRPNPTPRPPKRPDFPARVVSVTDGDTIVVRSGSGRRFKVRLIGIDTPEVFGGVECGGRQASASMKRLAPPGRRVRVYGDPTQDRRDAFGRLLAYVKTRGGPQLNIAQVRKGWAKVFVFQGNPFRQTASFRRAARSAKRGNRGVWGRCGGNFHRRVRSTASRVAIRCRSIEARNVRDGRTRYKVYRSRGSRSCLRARRVMRRWAFNTYRVARAGECRNSTCSNAPSPQGYRCFNGTAGAEIRSGFVQECRRGLSRFQSYTR